MPVANSPPRTVQQPDSRPFSASARLRDRDPAKPHHHYPGAVGADERQEPQRHGQAGGEAAGRTGGSGGGRAAAPSGAPSPPSLLAFLPPSPPLRPAGGPSPPPEPPRTRSRSRSGFFSLLAMNGGTTATAAAAAAHFQPPPPAPPHLHGPSLPELGARSQGRGSPAGHGHPRAPPGARAPAPGNGALAGGGAVRQREQRQLGGLRAGELSGLWAAEGRGGHRANEQGLGKSQLKGSRRARRASEPWPRRAAPGRLCGNGR